MYAYPSGPNFGTFTDWNIFYATYTTPNLFQTYSLSSTCVGCPSPMPVPNTFYTHYPTSANNFVTNLINVGMNAAQTTLLLHLTLTPVATISMNTGYS
jgi:hypothetical protein